MIPILANRSIPWVKHYFNQHFQINYFEEFNVDLLCNNQILLCRASDKLTIDDLNSSQLKIIATASSGRCHIPLNSKPYVIDAKGCNALSVTNYVLSTVAYVIKHNLLKGNCIGIIGLGSVGSLVNRTLQMLGFNILCYDPPLSKANPSFSSCSFNELQQCDLITLHVPYTQTGKHPTHHLINDTLLKQLSTDCVLINTSRGGIVDEGVLLNYPDIHYCCDVYVSEPNIATKLIDFATLCTPHIAGHSIEAKQNATAKICEKIHHYLNLKFTRINNDKVQSVELSKSNWVDTVLSQYNPIDETKQLKQVPNQFIWLRKAHTMRHDINYLR